MRILFSNLLFIFLTATLLVADINTTAPLSEKELQEVTKEAEIASLKNKLESIDSEINQKMFWSLP